MTANETYEELVFATWLIHNKSVEVQGHKNNCIAATRALEQFLLRTMPAQTFVATRTKVRLLDKPAGHSGLHKPSGEWKKSGYRRSTPDSFSGHLVLHVGSWLCDPTADQFPGHQPAVIPIGLEPWAVGEKDSVLYEGLRYIKDSRQTGWLRTPAWRYEWEEIMNLALWSVTEEGN